MWFRLLAGSTLALLSALPAAEESHTWLAVDDECALEQTGDSVGGSCALSALQLKGQTNTAAGEGNEQAPYPYYCIYQPWLCPPAITPPAPPPPPPSWHSPWSPWTYPSTPSAAPASAPAPATRPAWWPPWWPAPYAPAAPGSSPPAPPPNPTRLEPSHAPLLTFYMYRVQSDENYPPENQNMGNLAGMLWYLHNEIVWHPGGRHGTFFSVPKTRLERWKVSTRATKPLAAKGMNFGVVNTFDSGQCTGPFGCENFPLYGNTVGCESWAPDAANSFPHGQWVGANHYPGALWFSLPGACTAEKVAAKTAQCKAAHHGGACPAGVTPTGESTCTYSYEKMGEISIDELEGIADYAKFRAQGGKEYDQLTDKGVGTSFWDQKNSTQACQARIDHAKALFAEKFPDQPDVPDPTCDFNKYVFYDSKKDKV